MLSSDDVLTTFTVASAVGAALAVYRTRRGKEAKQLEAEVEADAEQRARDWRDTAEQRLAAINDRDRLIRDFESQMKAMAEEQGRMRATISHLEAEIAELKRHDLSAVTHLVNDLGHDLVRRLDEIKEQTTK